MKPVILVLPALILYRELALANPNPLGLSKRAAPDNTVVVNGPNNYWYVLPERTTPRFEEATKNENQSCSA